MPISCRLRLPCRLWAPCLIGLLLLGCGGDQGGGSGAGTEDAGEAEWSRPAGGTAAGSPDGAPAAPRSPEALLSDLRERVAAGRGHSDVSYQRSVEDVASVLFDTGAEAPAEDLDGARAHMQVAAIAGEVSVWLRAGADERAAREKSHPTDVAIHDRFLEVSQGGPEAYKAWCAEGAPALLRDHREATYARLMGDQGR